MFKYSMQLFWSDEDGEYVALVPEFPYVSALAETPQEAAREAVIAAEAVVEGLVEDGLQPPQPQTLSSYSGQIRVRMPRTLHQRLAGRARIEGVSLNTLIVTFLAEGLGAQTELPAQAGVSRPKQVEQGAHERAAGRV